MFRTITQKKPADTNAATFRIASATKTVLYLLKAN